jgi:hypothetical protein
MCAVVVPGRHGVLGLHTHALTVLAWLTHTCLDSVGHLCIRCQLKKNHVGPHFGREFLSEHFRNRVPCHIGKSKKSVPIGTLFPKCSRKNTFLIMQKWAISSFLSCTLS